MCEFGAPALAEGRQNGLVPAPPPPRHVAHIAVTVGRVPAADGRVLDGAPHAYTDALVRAGAVPVMLPRLPPQLAKAALAGMDGLLLTGGGDVGPSCYGAEVEPETHGVDGERDSSELALLGAATDLGIPVLAICRGFQLLNISRSGSLHQHLARYSPLLHDEFDRRYQVVHAVDVAAGSLLHEVVGVGRLQVNSVHHQGLDRLGEGLKAVAWAEDGLVEGVEVPGQPVLGVQWHPELVMEVPGSIELFSWLVTQAVSGAGVLTRNLGE